MDLRQILLNTQEKLREAGAIYTIVVRTSVIEVAEWVRLKCQYGCPDYGKNRTCPPYTPDARKTRRILKEFNYAVFYTAQGHDNVREIGIETMKHLYSLGIFKVFPLMSGKCRLCDPCSVDNCKFPHLAYPSLEACSIDVFSTVKKLNIELVNNGSYLHVGAILL